MKVLSVSVRVPAEKPIGLLVRAALFRPDDSLSLLRTIEGQKMIDSECLVMI